MHEWREYFESPTPLRLYVMHTGEVRSVGTPHLNPKSPNFKKMPKTEEYNPVFAFLVEHPHKGLVLLDTGLHASFARSKSGNFGMFLGALVNARTEPGKDVCSQLTSLGRSPTDVKYIFLSHLHLDHDSGLPYFKGRNDVHVFVDEEELGAARSPLSTLKGYVARHREGIVFQTIPYQSSAPPFDRACDFFGDGSMIIVRTHGHTKGHCSVIVNAGSGPILLTFDAVHRRSNLDEDIPPSGDYAMTLSAMRSVKSFLADFPRSRVIFGHDGAQLKDLVLAPKYYL